MGTIPKNVLREITKESDFKNPGEIYAYANISISGLLLPGFLSELLTVYL